MPRATKYKRAVVDVILEGIREGLTETAAVWRSGIHYDTFREWKHRYPQFSAELMRAHADAEASFTAIMVAAAQPHEVIERKHIRRSDGTVEDVETIRSERHPQLALEWLKRRRNAQWGDRRRIDVRDLSTEQLLALAEQLEEDEAGDGSAGAGAEGRLSEPGEPS